MKGEPELTPLNSNTPLQSSHAAHILHILVANSDFHSLYDIFFIAVVPCRLEPNIIKGYIYGISVRTLPVPFLLCVVQNPNNGHILTIIFSIFNHGLNPNTLQV